MRDEKLSEYFARSEFACKGVGCCGGAAPVDPRLIVLLRDIRDAVGVPVTVTSGFRCPTHNATVPGAEPDSYHTRGMAADIKARGVSLTSLLLTARSVIRLHGFGWTYANAAQGIVHVDCRQAQ